MNDNNGDTPRSVIALIRNIQQGALAPKTLAVEDRQRCVEHLTGEGYSVAEIAEILQVSDRTIARDRSDIRQANALDRDPALVGPMVGHVVQQAGHCIERIRRITRNREIPAATRIDGERHCWEIEKGLIACLQSLGYLPKAATEIHGDLTHHIEALPGFTQMQEEVARIELILATTGIASDEELLVQLATIRDQVNRGALVEQIALLETRANEKEDSDDDSSPQ